MTHYYLYIAAGLTIDSNTHFYKVGIGELLMQIDTNYYTCQMLKAKAKL